MKKYIHIYTYTRAYIYIYTYMYIHTYTYIHTCIYIYTYMYIHTYTYLHIISLWVSDVLGAEYISWSIVSVVFAYKGIQSKLCGII
jgi:hypothetical protein